MSLASSAVGATDCPASACADEADASARLACYDRFFRAPASATSIPAASPMVRDAAPPPPAASAPAPGSPASPMTKFWQLAPAEKRGAFDVLTYRSNYLLPVHYTSSLRVPSSPTHPPPSSYPDNYQRVESKFQISLRTKALENVGLPGADLWLAYSQISLWQIYNHQDSAPFRSNDYQPEAIYVVPLGDAEGLRLPGDWRWRMVQLGITHQSNGQSDPLSRSWNRAWLGAGFERGAFGLQMRLNQRVHLSSSSDDNPDLVRYVGHGEVLASYVTDGHAATLTWKTGSGLTRGSLQLDWSYPVRRARADGLRWYVQGFTGYGETLLDYNHRQTSVGAGLALSQF